MKITFIMSFMAKPSGGLMVIYEYANQLVARGHEVTVVHAGRLSKKKLDPIVDIYRWLSRKGQKPSALSPLVEEYSSAVDSRVTMMYIPEPRASYIPDGDALFGSLLEGEEYPKEKGKRFRLFQGYRAMPWSPAQEDTFWRQRIPKVVIAQWLYEKGLELGVPAEEMIHIPNGMDHAKYRLLQPINNRAPRLAMLYHRMPLKGSQDGIKALELVRENVPSIQAVLFSFFPRPKDLPDWIEYHRNPPQEVLVESIYNGSSIYLCPSWREGWHLPPAEAMACGCAVASTDIGGVRDYAEHEVTALLSPPQNPEALAANILRLLEDNDLRIRLAKAGHECIQEFTWERSTDLLEQFLKDRV